MPEPDRESGSGDSQGQAGGPPPEDLFDRRPPTGEASVTPVAVVVFEEDYSPPSGAYYFRQGAWSEFNGTRLVPAEHHPEADRDVTDRFPTAQRLVVPGPPGDTLSVDDLLIASQQAAMRQDFEASGALAQQALTRSPGSTEAAYRMAVALMRRGDHAAALSVTEQLAERAPEELRVHALRADLELLMGDLPAARAGYFACLETDPSFSAASSQLREVRRVEVLRMFSDAGVHPPAYEGPLATDAIAAAETPPTPVESGVSRVRQEVHAMVALMTQQHAPFGVEWPVAYEDVRNPNRERFNRAYRFTSQSLSEDYANLFGRQAGDPRWSEDLRALYLEQNPDPRFAELANEIVSSIRRDRRDDPFARAVAIKLWLDERLTYSTAHQHGGVPDPTADFLFGDRTGYCVHFAHAAVFLWRAAGVPSRVGVGFHSAESNRQGGSALLLRSGDAHAWPELYLEGVGWIPLDISAHENLDEARPAQDIDLQQLLAEMAREEPPDPEDEVRDEEREEGVLDALIDSVVWTAPRAFVAILLGILLALYLIKVWRRISPSFAKGAALAQRSFRRDLDILAEVGVAREYGETREQFAKRAKTVSPAFEEATQMILAAKLGREDDAARVDVERWRTVQQRVRSEVNQNTKWWRRLLGLIHPAAFFDSR